MTTLYWKKDLEDSFMPEGGERRLAYLGGPDAVSYYDNHGPIHQVFGQKSIDKWGEDGVKERKEDMYKMKENFVKKVYGIFSSQIAIMACYIFAITYNKPKMDLSIDDNFEADTTTIKAIARNWTLLITCLVLSIITIILIISQMKALRNLPALNYFLGYFYCLQLTYIAGYATYRLDGVSVLAAFGCTLAISIIMAFFAKSITSGMHRKGNKGERNLMKLLGPVFGMLGTIAVLLCLILTVFPQEGKKSQVKKGLFLFIGLAIVLMYFLLDTFAITSGKYNKMIAEEDYIYGSSKLFADFVLCFTLLAYLFNGGDGA